MATREKKLSISRKQTNSVAAFKELIEIKTEPADEPEETPPIKPAPAKESPIVKKLARQNAGKKIIRKPTMAIKLKAKAKKPIKIKPKLVKNIMHTVKALEKKKLVKNGGGVKEIKPRKPRVKKEKFDAPPVLEPIFPTEENVEKKSPRKRMPKAKAMKLPEIDTKKIKIEQEEICGSDLIDESINEVVKPRKRAIKKPKLEPESIEDVMNDLSYLIKSEDIKAEVDSMSESSKSDTIKSKRLTKKQRLELLKKEIKKENIENTLNKLDSNDKKIIDMLDLNVANMKQKLAPTEKRRHSIEKFPIGNSDQSLQLFNNLPRCISPRAKRNARFRQSIDGVRGRRSSPYTTRSDSPARILRNGKHRKLKDLQLLEGLDLDRKRKRLCSDLSGSELSKLSGNDSDSSFSDMASIHGAEHLESKENDSHADKAITDNGPIDLNNIGIIDTNSNLCNNPADIKISEADKIVVDAPSEEAIVEEVLVDVVVVPSKKVPDKSIILDIMKQAFNERPIEEHLISVETKLEDDVFKEESDVSGEVKPSDLTEITEVLTNNQSAVEVKQEEVLKTEAETETENPTISISNDTEIKNDESPEELEMKQNILQALGLQSLKAAEEAKLKGKEKPVQKADGNYTGTLKTVIKINRDKKKGRNSLKMTLQKSKAKVGDADAVGGNDEGYKIMKEGASANWKQGNHSSDTADGSSEHTSDGEGSSQDGAAKLLVIPEKASSFSIHPGRLCKDECSYCFGKFGLFDTPCHIAQMKSLERQNKILASEKHLTQDSCLCDACYRHVDRKSNTPSYTNKSLKRNSLVAPGPRQNHCHVLGCSKVSTNILRRKWIIKMRKSVCQVINIDLDNPGLHSIPICDEHYTALEHLMVCAMCKRRLARNHIHYLGPETNDLNTALQKEGIPLTLSDKPVVCKLCKCFASVILKDPEERQENSYNFFMEYKKRLLHFNDIVPMDEAAAEEPITVPAKEKEMVRKRRKPNKYLIESEEADANLSDNANNLNMNQEEELDQHVPLTEMNQSRPESPSDYSIDYNTLIPAIAMECGSDIEDKKKDPIPPKKVQSKRVYRESIDISKIKIKNDKVSDIAVQRLGSNPSISVRQLFPGEEDMNLSANIDFTTIKEKTNEGWEKCSSIIQYDMETKRMWHELQKPYGNQSSFLRHLILLEKYFRNGDLILSASASHHSQNYSESVQNRLRSYDNVPSACGVYQSKAQKSSSGIITSAKHEQAAASAPKTSTPITLSKLNSPPLIQSAIKCSKAAPPGLISIHPTMKPVASTPIIKLQPQSQKIKFPITKNWRPNLIPIDPTKKQERKNGLVQVISGGKPFHITLEDYKKMCAIKRSFEMKQKRLQDAQNARPIITQPSLLKSMAPRKGLTISKTSSLVSPSKNNDFMLDETESILDKLDKQVEKLDVKLADKSSLVLPKIPKSLTVIPQTVARKQTRPSSPILLITQKTSSNKS